MRSLTIAALILTCLAPAFAQPQPMRLGDFEWTAELSAQERERLGIVTDQAHSGTYSMLRTATAGEHPTGLAGSNSFVLASTFPTAESEVTAWVKLEGEGQLMLSYPGDGRNALKVIGSPTDGWQPLRLHLRANPEGTAESLALVLSYSLRANTGEVKWWLDDLYVTPLYQHHPPKLTTPPVIDGDLSDACWNDESYAGDPYWRMYNKPRDARAATHVWCAYDDEHLYVAFRCMTPRPKHLVQKIAEHDGNAWNDDSAEIFFNPSHDHQRYYEYIVTPRDVVFDSKWFREGGPWQVDWNYFGRWKAAIETDAWTVEIALDLRSYEERDAHGDPTGYMPLPTGGVAGILFSRNDRVLNEGMSWADCNLSFHEVEQYGHLVGFKPNYAAGYRKYALREIGKLEDRWNSMYIAAGRPELVPGSGPDSDDGTQGIAEAIASLRARAESPSADFDEWVAIGREIKRVNDWLKRAETLLAADTYRVQHTTDDGRYPPVAVTVASPFDFSKVASAGDLPESLRVADAVEVSAAQGEYEPIRFYLLPLTDEPVTIDMPGRLRWKREYFPLSFRFHEDVGGPVVPVSQVTVEPGKPKRLWCVLEVPRTIAPGEYDLEFTWTQVLWGAKIKLAVRDFALPRDPSLPVAASFTNAYISDDGRDVLATTPDRYWRIADQLLRHRVTPCEMLADFTRWQGDEPDFSLADQALVRAGTLGFSPEALMLANQSQLAKMTDPMRKLDLARVHWRQKLGVDLAPVYAGWAGHLEDILSPRQLQQSVVAHYGLPASAQSIHGTPTPGVWGKWAVDPRLATRSLDALNMGVSDVLQAADESATPLVWNLAWVVLQPELPRLRMTGWLAFKYKPALVIYPEMGHYDAGPGDAPLRLLWEGAGRSGYPEPTYDPPVPTMELEMLRDGLEDYEYLRLLSDLDRRLRRTGLSRSHVRLQRANWQLLRRNDELMRSAVSYTDDPEVLMRWREDVATQIERTRAWLRACGQEGLPGD